MKPREVEPATPPPRVLIATGLYPPAIGGPATYVRSLAREMGSRGGRVEVVTYGRDVPRDDPFPVHAVSAQRQLPLRYLAFFRAVLEAARRADVVLLQDPISSGLPGFAAARLAGKPVVLKVVGDAAWEIARDLGWTRTDFEAFPTARKDARVAVLGAAQRWVARGAHAVIVPGRYLVERVRGWGVPPDRISVIPNGIAPMPLPDATPDEAKAARGLAGRTVVTYAGRLVTHKNVDLLLQAFAVARRGSSALHLVVAGSGPEQSRLERLVGELDLTGAVTFTGDLDRQALAWQLRATDVLALLSSYEGLSHVLIEALQAGLAILASRAGGNPEVVEDGQSGLLVDLDDARAIGSRLASLCSDAHLRQRLGTNARARAELFAWTRTVQLTLAELRAATRTSAEAPAI